MLGATALAVTVIVRAKVAVALAAFVTVMIRFVVPTDVGVPLITPVCASSERPAGNETKAAANVSGFVPVTVGTFGVIAVCTT